MDDIDDEIQNLKQFNDRANQRRLFENRNISAQEAQLIQWEKTIEDIKNSGMPEHMVKKALEETLKQIKYTTKELDEDNDMDKTPPLSSARQKFNSDIIDKTPPLARKEVKEHNQRESLLEDSQMKRSNKSIAQDDALPAQKEEKIRSLEEETIVLKPFPFMDEFVSIMKKHRKELLLLGMPPNTEKELPKSYEKDLTTTPPLTQHQLEKSGKEKEDLQPKQDDNDDDFDMFSSDIDEKLTAAAKVSMEQASIASKTLQQKEESGFDGRSVLRSDSIESQSMSPDSDLPRAVLRPVKARPKTEAETEEEQKRRMRREMMEMKRLSYLSTANAHDGDSVDFDTDGLGVDFVDEQMLHMQEQQLRVKRKNTYDDVKASEKLGDKDEEKRKMKKNQMKSSDKYLDQEMVKIKKVWEQKNGKSSLSSIEQSEKKGF
ncbi:uncharacterized protein MONOS_10769 [Monocercomonoides exilis]|uniref:uncharacterized protein n=1 Tax=Monocercomonoides exilis TaxID=2049356 RepID=UPI003559F8F8|nr:hypothetical protein MONOS_10769 [Monocercomonoides exilis]|eukprot:MONOS_10769.1-p1 / transcript=MONOS_10769.1 / gene=MONOS_10769 / organism=Monocercomonoides_exilis_PA203 / gene_product=unspecified product / transcript_product=unspecified product / location=Mono_scaffold00503:35545-37004(+) / protein_length=432 / sequence_SO=supercontig / SO=protein_coding / is_pseudo=false